MMTNILMLCLQYVLYVCATGHYCLKLCPDVCDLRQILSDCYQISIEENPQILKGK